MDIWLEYKVIIKFVAVHSRSEKDLSCDSDCTIHSWILYEIYFFG